MNGEVTRGRVCEKCVRALREEGLPDYEIFVRTEEQ
jgi:hypothetical protein